MTPDEVEELIDMLEGNLPLTSYERDRIAQYIRHSAPLCILAETEQPVLDLCTKCEDKEVFHQETHDVRNALTKLYGYQVLHYV